MKPYGNISLIPQEIINTYFDDETTPEEPINHTGANEVSNNSQPAVSITDSSTMNCEQSNATVNDVNLPGLVFTKLLMQLYTHDQKWRYKVS